MYEHYFDALRRVYVAHGAEIQESFNKHFSSALVERFLSEAGKVHAEITLWEKIQTKLVREGWKRQPLEGLRLSTCDEIRARMGQPGQVEIRKRLELWHYAGVVVVVRRGLAWRLFRR
jgi:hypothetical protein